MNTSKRVIKINKGKYKNRHRRNKKRSLYSLLLMLCFTITILIILAGPVFAIQTVNIKGNENLSDKDIRELLNIEERTNIFKFLMDNYLVKDADLDPYIDELEITIDFPREIIIEVNEREVVGYVPYLGTYLCIDEEGRVIDSDLFINKSIPIIVGLSFEGFNKGEVLNVKDQDFFLDMVKVIQYLVKFDIIDDIIKLEVSNPTNIKMYTTNMEILFGDVKDINKKINIISQIIKDNGNTRGTLDIRDLDKHIIYKDF